LDANDNLQAEVMIAGAIPPANWLDVTPAETHKKLDAGTEDKGGSAESG